MAIAKVARIELMDGAWPDLLAHLHTYVAPERSPATRAFALSCLGFVCEEHADVADGFPQQETNRMLTSIVQGMAGNQPTEVRLHATRALGDALEFATMNFERQEERDYLMQARRRRPSAYVVGLDRFFPLALASTAFPLSRCRRLPLPHSRSRQVSPEALPDC